MDDLLPTQTLYDATEESGMAVPDAPHQRSDERPVRASGDSAADPPTGQQAPFVIELRRADLQYGHFRPEAVLIVTPVLRTGGLLNVLPTEDLASLLTLLTFLTPNGDILPTVPELAGAMGVAERAVRYRLERLMRFSWQGKPLVFELSRESGLHAYTVSPALVAVREEKARRPDDIGPVLRTAGREAVIAHSRAAYNKPRQYVEEMIAKLNNWDVPDATHDEKGNELPPDEARTLRTRLVLAGVARAQADLLLAHYPLERIRDQLDWLPLRYAKSPARFLVAAIEKDFAPPRGLPSMPPPAPEDGQATPPDNVPPPSDPSAP
jgi:hypothetical protein